MRIPLNQLRKLIREELHSSHRQQFLEQRGRRARRERRADEEALEALAAEEEVAADAAEAGEVPGEVEVAAWTDRYRQQVNTLVTNVETGQASQEQIYSLNSWIAKRLDEPRHPEDERALLRWQEHMEMAAPGGVADITAVRPESAPSEVQVARVEVPAGGLSLGTDHWTPSGYHFYVEDDVIRFVHPSSGKVVTVSEESNKQAWDAILGNVDGANEAYMAAVAAHTGAAAAEEVPARTQALVDATESWTAPGQPGSPAMVTKGLMLSGRDLGRQESAWHATLAVGGYSEGVDEDNDPTDNWSQSEWLASEEDTLPSWAEGWFELYAGGGVAYLNKDGSGSDKFDDVALYHIPKQDEWSWLGNYVNETLHDVYDIVSAGTGEEVVATGDGDADAAAQAAAVGLDEQRRQGKLIAERWQRLAGMKVL